MNFQAYLNQEWVKALGCTEPASIALAAATAGSQFEGRATRVKLVVDPKIYKNCHAVGIPHSEHKTGILWAAAIGANLMNPEAGLECFHGVDKEILESAQALIDSKGIEVKVDTSHTELFIDCTVEKKAGRGRAVIAGDHTNIILLEKDGEVIQEAKAAKASDKASLRSEVASMKLEDMIAMANDIGKEEMGRLKEGIELNRRIAEHGLTLFPKHFVELSSNDSLTRISTLVCAGVYARMWGEDLPVMSLAGSGNKGIVTAVPIPMRGQELGASEEDILKGLALACLVTTATTHHLGALSAVCGCSNAAGIGLAAGLVLVKGGGTYEIGLAINNMVGNVSGMICDGAKIGCALKTMTAVDAAFRSSTLAMSGIGIPPSDGIVGEDDAESLRNIGRIATTGMMSMDGEILSIMQGKLKRN